MIEVNPKWKKAETIVVNCLIGVAIGFVIILFTGLILDYLSEKGIISEAISKFFTANIDNFVFFTLIAILGLVFPCMIISRKVPAREDIVDDQLLTILQRTENIEKRLTQNEKEIAEMEDQLRAKIESPLVNVSQEKEQAIIAKLQVVAKPKEGTDQFNRAAAAQFMRALQLLGYIDSAEKPNTLRLWIENVTGYRNPDKSHFAEAYKRANEHSGNVATYMQEIG